MSSFLKTHLPCPCGKSSDAYAEADDHGFCFSCSKSFKFKDKLENEATFTIEYLPWRGVSADTMRRYGVHTRVNASGKPYEIIFPYTDTASKVRRLDFKEFYAIGGMKDATLFGMGSFSAGSARAVTITEGELDALSMYQALQGSGPVVSVRGASSAKVDCKRAFAYLNSFEKIYLALDSDEQGQKATAEIATLFDFNKVYHVRLDKWKDANGYVEAGQAEELRRVWWNSKRFLPEGVLSSFSDFDSILDSQKKRVYFPFPFAKLNEMAFGLPLGEVVLLTAMEGVGKTEIIRSMEYKLLKETDHNIGTIHLEEDKARQLHGLVGYELRQPVHLPQSFVSGDDIKSTLRSVIKRDDRLHIYNHFGSDDPDVIIDTIRFLVAHCECKYVFLDHITMVVTGLGEEDERKALDRISTQLAMMVKELDFCLVMVSHVNDEGKTRGSRNISKVATTWIHLSRDLESTDDVERNTTHLIIKKNRLGAHTGSAGALYFDVNTYLLEDFNPEKISSTNNIALEDLPT